MQHEGTLAGSMESDGFVIARAVLSSDEVALLRIQVDAILDDRGIGLAGGTVLPNAAVGAPELAWLFSDSRLIGLAAGLLGTNDVMFTFEADLHRNFLAASWHRDTGEGHMPGATSVSIRLAVTTVESSSWPSISRITNRAVDSTSAPGAIGTRSSRGSRRRMWPVTPATW